MERKLKPILNITPENIFSTGIMEEHMVASVLEMMKQEEKGGKIPFAPAIVERIENELRTDRLTAHRIFAMAMQRYSPGMLHIPKAKGEYLWERR